MNERNLQPRGGSIIYFRTIWESISGIKVLCQFLSEVNFKVEVLTDDVERGPRVIPKRQDTSLNECLGRRSRSSRELMPSGKFGA